MMILSVVAMFLLHGDLVFCGCKYVLLVVSVLSGAPSIMIWFKYARSRVLNVDPNGSILFMSLYSGIINLGIGGRALIGGSKLFIMPVG